MEREPEALQRLLGEERLANARRVNSVRAIGISFFFGLFLLLGVVFDMESWQGNLRYFGPYWAVTILLFVASRRWTAVNRVAGVSIAFLDVPMVFFLQWAQYPTSPNDGAIAGWNLGIYIFLLILSTLSLQNRVVYITAVVAALFEALLQHLAGITVGAIVATFMIIALAAAACAYGSRRLQRMLGQVANDLAAKREAEAALAIASKELEIASRIQSSIVPREVSVPGFDIASHMTPMTQVGGDYFDIRRAEGGAWVGIGDVSGHGLGAGLVMLMVQTALATLTQDASIGGPEQVVQRLNRVMYDNIKTRLGADDYVTCSVLRLFDDGRFTLAGRHEPIVVWRAATNTCEVVETPGTWLGVKRDVAKATVASSHALAEGDVIVLYTDGVTEAARGDERFGIERLCAATIAADKTSAATTCEALVAALEAWTADRADDVTFVVMRFVRQ